MSNDPEHNGGTSHESRHVAIGDLSRAVGVPIDTLRTWERRYGVPAAVRLPSGHRRYPVDAIPRLRRIAELIHAGHRASSVLTLDERDLDALLGRADQIANTAAASDPDRADGWLDATRALDADRIDGLLAAAWSQVGPIRAMDEVLGPALIAVGQRWLTGEITVGHEHFVSERVQAYLSNRWRDASSRAAGPTVVCTSLPGEHHVLGVHMSAVAVAEAGLRVAFLGRDTPLGSIRDVAASSRAHAVLISISVASDPSTARALLERLADELPNDVELLAGGAGAPDDAAGVRIVRDLRSLHAWALQQR